MKLRIGRTCRSPKIAVRTVDSPRTRAPVRARSAPSFVENLIQEPRSGRGDQLRRYGGVCPERSRPVLLLWRIPETLDHEIAVVSDPLKSSDDASKIDVAIA